MAGLGQDYWKEVITILRSIIPIYDKVNRAISLGQDIKYREIGINGRVHEDDMVLDAGSGFGNMTLVLSKVLSKVTIVMYDPIFEMLQNGRKYVDSKYAKNASCGIFEKMPFKDDSFDVVLCGYSLRDSINLKDAISEIHRVLKNNGRFVIVDLGKPDNLLFRSVVSIYLKYFLKVLAFSISGKMGLKFKTLHGTYLKWPSNCELYQLLAEKFSKIEMEKRLLGGAIIVGAYKQ